MAKKKEKIKLTRAEKKQLQELMTRRQQQSGKKGPRTAQDTIPYQRMWPDGICRVTDNYYTKTIQFQDINYQLAQNDDKTSIFEGWCDFLNYFDASTGSSSSQHPVPCIACGNSVVGLAMSLLCLLLSIQFSANLSSQITLRLSILSSPVVRLMV